jgi:hypothetical protein
MRYKDIADVRLRGRRESFGPRRRIKANDLRIDSRTGLVMPSTEARKAQRPMSDRWLATLNSVSHPIARLWRGWLCDCRARFEKKNPNAKRLPKGYHYRPILATSAGWKSFKKRAHAEGNEKIARAMAR